jgi:Holliday junction resolvase RusA-like endonuclease
VERRDLVIRFTLLGEPIAKARARTYPATDKSGNIIHRNGKPLMKSKTPGNTKAWEEYISLVARQAAARAGLRKPIPLGTPVTLGCLFYMPIPSSWSPSKKQQAREGIIEHTSVPDLSNLFKCIEDGAEKVLWHNDSQITCYGTVDGVQPKKLYAREARTEVEVRTVVG